jgi:isopentenyl-diphosphate delta-isomerase type 1
MFFLTGDRMSHYTEFLDVVDRNGGIIGRATREECHSNPTLIHRIVHVFIMNKAGDILMQKRSLNKDTQPGMWDISISGHVALGETIRNTVSRKMKIELGLDLKKLTKIPLEELYTYLWRSPRQTHLITTFMLPYEGDVMPNEEEVSEARFWTREEIRFGMSPLTFTPGFMDEVERFNQLTKAKWKQGGTEEARF